VRILDSHLHLWDPTVLTYAWLEGRLLRRFGPEDYREAVTGAVEAADARAAVFVQAECAPEHSLAEVNLVGAAAPEAGIVGIVARAGVERGDAVAGELDILADRPLVVGVRRLIQDEAPGFARSDAFVAGAGHVARRGLTFDACVRWHQLDEVIDLAARVPDLRIVVDHLGKPPLGTRPRDAEGRAVWERTLRRLATHPHVHCKLSGLPAESHPDTTAATWEAVFDVALDAFGPGRLLFGGDWPVSWPYHAWEAAVREWTESRVPDDAPAILAANAERFYGVSISAAPTGGC
jgi:L-fuconolactonase